MTSAMKQPGGQLLMFAGVLWALGGSWYLLSEAVAARAFPGYSYARDYISDLGAGPAPSPLAAVMNLGFVHQGLLFVLAAGCASRAFPPSRGRSVFLGVALAHGLGLMLVALFPSAPQAAGGGTDPLHTVGACLGIVGGNAAVIAASYVLRSCPQARRLRWAGLWLGCTGLGAAGMLVVTMAAGDPVVLDDGMWERLAVYSFIAWQLLVLPAVLQAGSPVAEDGDAP